MRGKPPRRLQWAVGLIVMICLIGIAIFFADGADTERREAESVRKAEEAKEAAKASTQNATEAAAQAQTEKALDDIKGSGGSITPATATVVEGNTGERPRLSQEDMDRELARIEAQRKLTEKQMMERAQLEREMARKQEMIYSAGIFKRGGGAGAQQRQSSPLEDQSIRMINDLRANNEKAMADAKEMVKAMTRGGDTNPKSIDPEIEFNEEMEARTQLPQPGRLFGKSPSNCMLAPGWLIPVANINPINSDLPGEFSVQVREDVYDSITGRCKAIPKGSKIFLTYNSQVKVGQERLNIAATLLWLPNGKKVPMLGTKGIDRDGYSGLEADVDNHWVRMFGAALLIGFLDKRTNNEPVVTSQNGGGTTTSQNVLSKVTSETATAVLERNKTIAPTLRRDFATRFNLQVSREFWLEEYVD
jgi:type IV secretion system protein VirB10